MSAAPLFDPQPDDLPATGTDGARPAREFPPLYEISRVPRVILDARVELNLPTGLGRYAVGLACGIASSHLPLDLTVLVHSDLDRKHLLFDLPDRAEPPTRIKVVRVPVRGVHLAQHWQLQRHLRRIPHDLYHYPHFDLPLVTCRPSIITIHDLKFLRFPELLPNRGRSLYVQAMMRLSTNRARHIVAVSNATRSDLQELLRVPLQRVTVIPEAAAPEDALRTATGSALNIRPPAGLAPGYLLFLGERRPHKNLVALISAYAQARATIPTLADLVIAGPAHGGYSEPEQTVARLGIERHVHFLEGVSDQMLEALYAHASIFLLPSLYEGFGLPILEAMQAGLPVLTSNISSMPEVGGDAALLVDPHDVSSITDGIQRLATDTRLTAGMVERGHRWSRQFTWERVARATFRVYRRALVRRWR